MAPEPKGPPPKAAGLSHAEVQAEDLARSILRPKPKAKRTKSAPSAPATPKVDESQRQFWKRYEVPKGLAEAPPAPPPPPAQEHGAEEPAKKPRRSSRIADRKRAAERELSIAAGEAVGDDVDDDDGDKDDDKDDEPLVKQPRTENTKVDEKQSQGVSSASAWSGGTGEAPSENLEADKASEALQAELDKAIEGVDEDELFGPDIMKLIGGIFDETPDDDGLDEALAKGLKPEMVQEQPKADTGGAPTTPVESNDAHGELKKVVLNRARTRFETKNNKVIATSPQSHRKVAAKSPHSRRTVAVTLR